MAVAVAAAAAEARGDYGEANLEAAFRGDVASVVRAVVVTIAASLHLGEEEVVVAELKSLKHGIG